jgi:hypothetical protein
LGKSASHIWRSVVDGKDMLKQGLIKRIGTWECTHIWNFDWLLRDGLLRSVACFLHDPPNMWSGLYDPVTVSWDLEKLKDVFLPMDVEAILNTPRLQGRRLMGVALRVCLDGSPRLPIQIIGRWPSGWPSFGLKTIY